MSSKRLTPLVLLKQHRLVRRVLLDSRAKVGSDPSCDVVLDDDNVPPSWGVVFSRGGRVYAQHEGGAMLELEPGDGLVVGSFVVARCDPGTRLARAVEAATPGTDLDFGRDEPFRRVVLTSSVSRAAWQRKQSATGAHESIGSATDRLSHSETATRGIRTRTDGSGQRFYHAEPHHSAAVERAAGAAIRPLEGRSGDVSALEQAGHDLLDRMMEMSFPEVVALLRRMATAYGDNYLEGLYRKVLNRSPMLAFRWSLVVAERFARGARSVGSRIELPGLSIGLTKLVSGEALEGFRQSRTHGAKIAAKGPW
jgi:hypothetical protein